MCLTNPWASVDGTDPVDQLTESGRFVTDLFRENALFRMLVG
jgi:hypothetical protein